MPSSVTSKGQVTIPKTIRDWLNIRTNDRVEFVREGNRVILVPVRTLKDLRGAVPARRKIDFPEERRRAKAAVARRVREETG
jgi:AbrB family looped-hinge helix DNA binding protein